MEQLHQLSSGRRQSIPSRDFLSFILHCMGGSRHESYRTAARTMLARNVNVARKRKGPRKPLEVAAQIKHPVPSTTGVGIGALTSSKEEGAPVSCLWQSLREVQLRFDSSVLTGVVHVAGPLISPSYLADLRGFLFIWLIHMINFRFYTLYVS